jgi:hypothetical protein
MEVIFLNAAISFGRQTLFQNIIPSVSFAIWETKRGLHPAITEDGEK